MAFYAQGIFSQTTPHFGFVKTADGEEFYISKFDSNGAFSGDIVNIRIVKQGDERKKSEAIIVKIVKRTESCIIGTYKIHSRKGKKYHLVLPYQAPGDTYVLIPEKYLGNVRNGDVVTVKILSGVDKPIGAIESIIGNERERDIEERIILLVNNITEVFEESIIKDAEKCREKSYMSAIRRDLRSECIVTIDSEDTGDIDDAISVEKLPNGHYRLGVHIADVAHYVEEGSPLDIEALRRGTSIYMPGRVIPMLPSILSDDLCSLHPGQAKATLSISMEIDPKGKVVSSEIFESVIHSREKLVYEEVARYLDTGKSAIITDTDIRTLLDTAFELKKIIYRRRKESGKIDFDFPELKIKIDEKGKTLEVKKRERNEAHKLIEEFMILANEEVSRFFSEKQIPFLYRTHDTPGDEALQKLSRVLAEHGYRFDPRDPKTKDIDQILQYLSGKPFEYHLSRLTLQSMARAQYSDKLLGHYGLGLTYYSHFTSPIRRYPDLQIHRIMKEYLHGTFDIKRQNHYEKKLLGVAQSCSNTEQKAENIERTIKDLKIIDYMQGHIGKTFSGTISHIVEIGAYVELDNGIEGFVHERYFRERYLYDADKQSLIAKKPTDSLFIGKPVHIRVMEANKKSRRLDFSFEKNR